MGAFKNFRVALAKAIAPRSTIELNNLLDFLGVDKRKPRAINEATYFACMKVLSEAIGKLPLKVLKNDMVNGGVMTAYDHPLYNVLRTRPNPYMTSTSFWSTVEFNCNHYGNAYVLIDGAGENMKLWILESDKVQIVIDDAKMLRDQRDIYYVYSGSGQYLTFGSEEILHFKTSTSFDGISGLSVRDILRTTIDGNVKSQNMLNRLYDNGFVSKVVVQYTGNLNDDNVKAYLDGIQRYAENKTKGVENLIPIPLGSKVEPLNMKLTDSQFLEIKRYSALQIASAFGIKPYQIGDYEKSSYASAEAQQLSFYVDTLLYILKQYEEEISYKLFSREESKSGLTAKFNVAVILRADLKTQIETLASAVGNFIYTPNEARALLDLENKPGGDKLLGNGASIPVDLAGIQYRKDATQNNDGKEENLWQMSLTTKELKSLMESLSNPET
ncbi:MAG: phage portal protein [Parabacteroides sp.]|nr:phage portal protein [Parabacteroides sp.]